MHYLGNAAIDNAAVELGLKGGDKVIDIGSGFSATGRYLHQKCRVDVTGIELQDDIHQLAEVIIEKSGMADHVRSVNGDFLQLNIDSQADHIVSFLCILHIPDRIALFSKAAAVLRSGGNIYIEDFYARELLDEDLRTILRDAISCPYLPGRQQYEQDLEASGFENVKFHDVSSVWSEFVRSRAKAYRDDPQHDPSLSAFYDAVDTLFASGQVGGCRITANIPS
jgi:cyclopropane fatty-acyl-phospholipid synthase-like methyltransferase